MATPPPDHSGLRPLGPYGEGYCPKCRFVVGLTDAGRLEKHWRMVFPDREPISRDACKGSYTRPPKVTPYASRKAAFKVTIPGVYCPVCGRRTRVLRDGRMNGHVINPGSPIDCPASWKTFEEARSMVRDHGSERG